MGSSSFYVDERHRGQGGRIFLQYCRLGKSAPLFGTSANSDAAALWKASGASPLPYSDGELFGVLHWPPVAEEFAHRKYSSEWLTRLARSPITNLANWIRPLQLETTMKGLRPLTSARELVDLLIDAASPKLTCLRDAEYLTWRYFSGHDSTTAAFAFDSRELEQEVLLTVNERARGYRGQIKTLNVLDVYPEVSVNERLRIVGALAGRYGSAIDAIVLRSLSPEQQEFFVQKGFQMRAFESPNGWLLDKKKLLPTRDWYPVPADGDGLI